MLKEEIKKLYIKHYGLILMLAVFIVEIIQLNLSYSAQKFETSFDQCQFYKYMEEFSGKLTNENKSKILAEQERIVDAQNVQSSIERDLISGEYNTESEFLAEYEAVREIAYRNNIFECVMEKYYYAEKSPENRYLTAGDYSALGQDYPDIILLAAVIILSVFLFLNEEMSNVITFIKMGENGRKKTLFGKLIALFIFIFLCQMERVVCEFVILISQVNSDELLYPVQSIEFFANCPYNISILQCFLAISGLRFVGYLFVTAFVVLLSVTLKKALFTMFIPSAVCILQQFVFTPATLAYYIPTGFLRACGYFCGNIFSEDGETKLFSEVPFLHLIVLFTITLVFIVSSIMIANNYYSGLKTGKMRILPLISIISVCVLISSCSAQKSKEIQYNLAESAFFAQDEDSYFISDTNNITQYFKNGDTEITLIHGLYENNDMIISLYNTDDKLLYMQNFIVNGISLSDYTNSMYYTTRTDYQSGFLEINPPTKDDKSFFYIAGFFTVDDSMYYVCNNQLQKDGYCIIDEGLYNSMLCCDGRNIFYVNRLLQLKCYDMKNGENSRLSGEFVRAIYYDGTHVLYSDKRGIFVLDTTNFSTEKLSDISTEQLYSNGSSIFYSIGEKIYRLGSNEPLYDEPFIHFVVVDNDFLIVQNTDLSCRTVDLKLE